MRRFAPMLALMLALPMLGPAACAPAAIDGGFDSDNPGALLYAAREAGETRDRSAIPRLIELLDHDDPAVRLVSIMALERITGQSDRLGYDPYADLITRRDAIRRWVDAYENGFDTRQTRSD